MSKSMTATSVNGRPLDPPLVFNAGDSISAQSDCKGGFVISVEKRPMSDETDTPVFTRRGVARLDFDSPAELAKRFAEWRHESPLIMDCFDTVEAKGGSEIDALRLCTLTFMELASQYNQDAYRAQLAANRAECLLAESRSEQ